jgi:NAD(P)-dependent dehydrogenase (short-subunit alcohol dehydrogenase family)
MNVSSPGAFMSLNPPITHWQGRTAWLVGASSGIGLALAHQLHAAGARVVISARNEAALNDFVRNHPGSLALPLDVTDRQAVALAMPLALAHSPQGTLDMVVYCAAHYRAQRAQQFDLDDALRHQRVNVDGALHWLNVVLPVLTRQRHGHLSIIASVAGYRGLPQSLAYGPTKAALINLAESLYLDLAPQNIGVSVINPGFVKTALTARNDFAMPALLTPEQAAHAIMQGWAKGRFEIHFPWRFTWWLKMLRHMPHRWYFPLVRRVTGG